MGKECRWVIIVAFAFGWILTAHAYAETIQLADPLDSTLKASLQFDQVSQSMGSYAWDKQADENSFRLALPPLVEGKQEALGNFMSSLPWLMMVASPGDPDVKVERPLGSVGRLSSSLAILRSRRQTTHDAPDGYQTGLNDKKSGGAFAAVRFKF